MRNFFKVTEKGEKVMQDVELGKLPLREGNQFLEAKKGGLEEGISSSKLKVLQEDNRLLEGKGNLEGKIVL